MGRLAGVALALAVAAALAVVAPGCARSSPPADAKGAAMEFLDRYADGDGRVVRRDQGGDTVSEGQAYGMLLAVVAGDRARFDLTWRWAREHLRRPDGLLAWRWSDGKVVDAQPAADADLDAAHALVLAGQRFREPELTVAGRRMGQAVADGETRPDGVLVAGPWARDAGVMNPSYFSPLALRMIGQGRVEQATHDRVAWLIAGGEPPPDWATAGPPPHPSGRPGGDGAGPAYGYDAARIPVRLAASCSALDRRLAADLRLDEAAPVPRHPVFTVAEAGQARAAGDAGRAASLLDLAAAENSDSPSYYGAAWVALGRALLQTDLLGACPGDR